MNNPVQLLEDDGKDVNLSELQELLNVLARKQGLVDDLEQKLKDAKKEVDHLEGVVIPEKMGALHEIKLRVGDLPVTVKIKEIVRANIKAEDKPAAYAWLDSRGHGDLIKTEVNLSFGRSELERAKEVEAKLRELGFSPTLDQQIHWATLSSFVKEQLAKGTEFPNIIGIYEGKKAEVKYGK